jgi:putative MATE family efflux protein
MRLLMPSVESDVFAEGLSYFRVLILSLPFLLLNNVLAGILRSAGDGKSPMLVAVLINLTQLLFAILFMRWMRLEAVGAGLTYLFSRLCGTALVFYIVLRSHHKFVVRPENLVKPHPPSFLRILRVGLPTSVESIFVQTGYLVANAMVLGLGTFQAAVFNVANTLYGFAAVPQSICATVAMPIIGHLIGACRFDQAKKTGWKIWMIGMSASLLLSGLIIAGGNTFCGIYTSDQDVLAWAVQMLWPVFFMCIPAISLNTLDPQLRVGGDVKYVMTVTVIAVWAIRLPLTWLMCYRIGMGAAGVFWANTISLSFRAVCNMTRFIRGKYLHMRV